MQRASFKEFDNFCQFENVPNQITAVFTKRKLNLGFLNQKPSLAKENREVVLSELNLRLDQLVCPQQTHSDHVYIVENKDRGRGAENPEDAISDTDAFITPEKDIALSIFVADCLPVYIVDKQKGIIALAHCGWKSSQKALLEKTLLAMRDKFDSRPQDMVLFFGPAIRKCCFEVRAEFLQYFKEGILRDKDKIFLDLIQVNYLQAKKVGVSEDNIFDSGICTVCQNDKFFSFRKEEDSAGRQMALLIRKEN